MYPFVYQLHTVDGDSDILRYCHDLDGQDPRSEDPCPASGHTHQGRWSLTDVLLY